MPELPEVETTKAGISPYILNQKIDSIVIRNDSLRWPVPLNLYQILPGQTVNRITRRAKYIIIECSRGTLICHLGMSGHFKIIQKPTPLLKHDHVDILFKNGICLRYHDPRRFGCILWTENPLEEHFLIRKLGIEPLDSNWHPSDLYLKLQRKSIPIKTYLMNQENVVGVGNIYASEALFYAKIHPNIPANKLSINDCRHLILAIQTILNQAILQGGTTLNDYMNSEGKPGYFSQSLKVYHREHQPCLICNTPIHKIIMGQRSTFYCPTCQPFR
jgi:formamidopyrimidine-DNA glycosylase